MQLATERFQDRLEIIARSHRASRYTIEPPSSECRIPAATKAEAVRSCTPCHPDADNVDEHTWVA